MTNNSRSSQWILGLLAFGFLAVSATNIAQAQDTEADLLRENLRLTTQVQQLQKDLKDALEKNKQLDARVAELETRLAATQQPAVPASPATPPKFVAPAISPEVVTIDESIPHASPRALFNAAVASYEQATAGIEKGQPGDGLRRGYIKKLDGWRGKVNREFRSPIKWYVRVIDSRQGSDGQRMFTLVAVDPQTDVRLGDQFDVNLAKPLVNRLARSESRCELGVMILRGTLIPEIRINEVREVRGSFDKPPFIGPFAEFLFHVDVSSLTQPREDEKDASVPTPAEKPMDPSKP